MFDPEHQPSIPVFDETLGGALIDAARISVMAAARAFPDGGPRIVLPGDNLAPTVADCLGEAMQWLDAARALSIDQAPEVVTSLHEVHR